MAGGTEDHDDSMEASDENEELYDSTDHSECADLDLDDMEFYEDVNEYCPVHQNLKDDIRKALASYPESEEELGIPSVQIDESKTNLKYISAVVLTFTLKDISEHLLELWDLEDTPAIVMEMDNIHRGEFRAYGQLPKITVKKHSSEGHFIVGEQLKNFVLRMCRESYSTRTNESIQVVGSFFATVYGRVKERLMRLSEYCVTCGEILSSGGVLPSICDRDLCMYQYSELHLFDGLSVPRVSPEVLSLLLFAFANANLSPRRRDILTPAPPIKSMNDLLAEAKTKRSEKKGESEEKEDGSGTDDIKGSTHWNYTVNNATIQRGGQSGTSTESATFSVLLENMPCPREILASVSAYHQFRKGWPQMADIVDWLVISNRSYLEMVPRPMNVDFLLTDSQYCFISDTPAKQAKFDELVAQNGGKTRFFFHGSPLENWHSIIRTGLKNMSGTKHQLVGAAYGKGIYLSPFLDFAIGYSSRMGSSFSRRHSGSGMTMDRPIRSDCKSTACCETERAEDLSCVALVEVVDCPDAYSEKTEEIFVVEKEEWCSIRMLLLYRQTDINKVYELVDKSWGRDMIRAGRPRRAATMGHSAAQSSIAVPSVVVQSSTVGGMGSIPPPPHPSSVSTPGGFVSFVMNKFSNWGGTPNTSSSTNQQTSKTQNIPETLTGTGSTPHIPKKAAEEANGSRAGETGTATLGTTSSSSSSHVIDDMWKEEEEEEEEAGSSGLQKEAEKEKKERLKMAVGDTEDSNDVLFLSNKDERKKEWMEMSEKWRVKREKMLNKMKGGDNETEAKKETPEKDSTKRKRCLSDPTSDVPKKTASSPSNDKSGSKLTEEDIKILEMFADSDLREDDVQITKVVKGKERKKKKKQAAKDEKKKKGDESDDDVKILDSKEGKGDKKESVSNGGLMGEGESKDEEGQMDVDGVSTRPSLTASTSSYSSSPFPTTPNLLVLPAPFSGHLGAGTQMSIPSSRHSFPPGGSLANAQQALANAQQILAATQSSVLSLRSSAYQSMQQLSTMQQQVQQRQHRIVTMRHNRMQMMGGPLNATAASITYPANATAPPSSFPSMSIPAPSHSSSATGTFPAPGTASFLQIMGGMFSRRRRRGNSVERGDTPIPGDLTSITDEQREQIYRVVRMFRNSGFEERVNRHMNREEKKENESDGANEEEVEGGERGGAGDGNYIPEI